MKKSREFNNILDECLETLLTKGATIEQCLQRFPKHADELKPLLETALAANKQVSAIQPSPDFRDRARYQFYSALQEMEHKKSRAFFSWGWQPRWATVVAIVLVLFVAGGSTAAAASGSMPDDPLYPVKLATEQVQLAFTFSSLGKAELYAKLAEKRVDEIAFMASKNKPEQIERTAQRLDTYLTKIAVLSSPQEVTPGVAMAPAVEEAPATEEELAPEEAPAVAQAPLAEQAPAAQQVPAVEQAPAAEQAPVEEQPSVAEQAKAGKEAEGKVDRRAKLEETLENQAKNNTDRLRALLETAPESAKPALEKAIDVSETGYEKALKSLGKKP